MLIDHVNSVFLGSLLLAGCGGSSEIMQEPPAHYPKLIDGSSQTSTSIVAFTLDSTTTSISKILGSIGPGSSDIELGSYQGQTSGNDLLFLLDGGGQLTLTSSGTEFASTFVLEPAGINPSFGVIGVPTLNADVPANGSMTYNGTSTLQVFDGTSFYDLTGRSQLTSNFTSGKSQLTLDNLQGNYFDGSSPPVAVANVGILSVDSINLSGSELTDGYAKLTSTVVSGTISAGATTSLRGSFFGPSATEVGGVLSVVDNTGSENLLLQGFFAAE